ncbi:MAG TPA: FAD-dependent monooxygenase [Pyrinomonadaceae bacterium]|jgi:flavin-dependent dehydrogenase
MNPGGIPDIYDAVIVGGGPAGAAAAIELARGGRAVLLLDRENETTFKVGEALPSACNRILRDLGAWESFLADKHLPSYANLAAWNQDTLESVDFIFDPNGHGWHLERGRFDAGLRSVARNYGAVVSTGAKMERLLFEPGTENQWCLRYALHNREKIEVCCRWVVDASGRRGAIVRQLPVRRLAFDQLAACFAVFEQSKDKFAAEDEDSRTLIEAAPDGWWYTALIPQNRRVVCYFTDTDLSVPQRNLPRTTKKFLSLLAETKHIREVISERNYRLCSVLQRASANSTRLTNFSGPGWLATGDAAMSFDPLSSQGILTGLYSGMLAGQTLNNFFSGEAYSLIHYEERLATIFDAYLANLQTGYNSEKRWSQREFWKRRQRTADQEKNGF